MTSRFNFSDRDKADILTLARLGVGQIVIGNLYGCSSGPIKGVLSETPADTSGVEASEPTRRFRGKAHGREVVDLPKGLASQVDNLVRLGRTIADILDLVACPLPQFLLCLSLSLWFSRCDRCHQRLRDCEESLWQYERDGMCGQCAVARQRQKHTIRVTLSDPEYAVVQALAKEYGLSVRTFVHRCLMELVALEVAG